MPGPGYSFFGDEEERNLLDVIRRWRDTSGSFGIIDGESQLSLFERELAEVFGVPYAIPVNCGTSALLTALAALDIGPGDEVIVPGYMFVASIGAIVAAGAIPVLAEIDQSLTLDPDDVRARITPRTRAIMAVHMLGAPSYMPALAELARDRGLLLVEDVAQACGGSYRGRLLGTWGDAGAFSLGPYKVITSGEGGFTLLREARAFRRGFAFHDQGWMPHRDAAEPGELLFGLNLRIDEFSAAVGRAQLAKLGAIVDHTRQMKHAMAKRIPSRDGLHRRLLHDPDGDCGTLLVYIFDQERDARDVAAQLGTSVLASSPKHYYAGIPELAALAAGEGPNPAPFRPRLPGAYRDSYLPGALPRTDDVLSRAIALAIGVSDGYLGAGFGITPRSSEADIDSAANRFCEVVNRVLG